MALEEWLRAIESSKAYGFIKLITFCLVPSIVLLKNFKVPEFEKSSGITNLRTHIIRCCLEMKEVAHDDKLLTHFFHRSLIEATLKWCIYLDRS